VPTCDEVLRSVSVDAVEVVVEAAEQSDARVVGVTGGVAAGKSTLAVAVADRLGAAVVASDGFLFDNATLAERGLTHRKGFPESFDGPALVAFLDGWLATGRAVAPVYSHLAYDVVGTVEVAGDRLVVEGLHLGHPALGGRDRIDLLVHVDGADDDLARWYLQRFQGLRAAAADDPEAFLHQFRDLPGEVLDQMAMDVWAGVNLVVLEEAVRPWAAAADLVIHLGPSHEVVLVERHP
jgi:type I pantothenate kinase